MVTVGVIQIGGSSFEYSHDGYPSGLGEMIRRRIDEIDDDDLIKNLRASLLDDAEQSRNPTVFTEYRGRPD